MNRHEGPGVIPGRYAGEPIRIHEGPTPQQVADEEQRADADALAGRICAAAAEVTRSQYRLLELVGEFDAMNAIRFWTDVKSLAQCQPAPGVGTYSNADALLDVTRGFLASAPEDRSGEDRTLVVVHVSAENLGGDVPAGTSQPSEAVCHIAGVGAIEAATAQRLACDNPLLGALVDKHGKALALGRTRRLVSKAQRRALMIRGGMCRYPGCHSTRHLKAHHQESGSTPLVRVNG